MAINYKSGESVVCPSYGVGVVKGVENQEIMGTTLKVVVVFFEKDRMTIRVPLNDSTSDKIRKLCTMEEMEAAINTLKEPSRAKKMMWSRRAQEYESKINSGVPTSIAEVIRDLHRPLNQPDHSFSERQLYQEALRRLAREYAAVAKIEEKQAEAMLEQVLLSKAA